MDSETDFDPLLADYDAYLGFMVEMRRDNTSWQQRRLDRLRQLPGDNSSLMRLIEEDEQQPLPILPFQEFVPWWNSLGEETRCALSEQYRGGYARMFSHVRQQIGDLVDNVGATRVSSN